MIFERFFQRIELYLASLGIISPGSRSAVGSVVTDVVCCGLVIFLIHADCLAQAPASKVVAGNLPLKSIWRQVEPGFALSRYELGSGSAFLPAEVLLLRINPEKFSFQVVRAAELNLPRADLRAMTVEQDGIAGINAHFFDEQGKELGLLISGSKVFNQIHKGGKLLTGIFLIKGNYPSIVQREAFSRGSERLALQSGPRLIVSGVATKVSSPDASSRRSGLAITRRGEVILYATFLRFPGATFRQLQKMLLDPALEVVDALNLDGGGSSQLYVRTNAVLEHDTFITGGDRVPVGLIVKRREKGRE